MKHGFILFFIFTSTFCYSQTWTKRNDEAKCDYEYTVITKEQYQRLLRQYEASNEYCVIQYEDVLEMEENGRIISGTRPTFNGYYYLLVKIKPQLNRMTAEERSTINMLNMSNGLCYGNSNTGIMALIFVSMYGMVLPGAVEIDSNDYRRKYNQFLGFVNNE